MRRDFLFALAIAGAASSCPAAAGTIIVTDSGASGGTTCTLAQAIDAANRANNPGGSYGATPPGATTVDPLRYSVARETGSGTCSGATAGANTISLQQYTAQTIVFEATFAAYPNQGWNDGVADRADNYWYGPNALPPIASDITLEGHGATLKIADGTRRLRFFFVGADARTSTVNLWGEPRTPGYNTPGAGKLTLRRLTLEGGRQLGGAGHVNAGGGAGLGGAIYNQGHLVLEASTLTQNEAIGGGTSAPPQQPYSFSQSGGGLGGDALNDEGGGMGGPVPNGSGDPGREGVPGCSDCAGGGGTPNALGGYGHYVGFLHASGNGSGGGGMFAQPRNTAGGGAGFRGGLGGRGFSTTTGVRPSGGDFGRGARVAGGGGVGGGGTGGSDWITSAGGFGGGGSGTGPSRGGEGGFGAGGGARPSSEWGGGFAGGVSGESRGGGGAGMGGAVFNHFATLEIVASTLTNNRAGGGRGDFSPEAWDSQGRGLGGALFNLNGTVVLAHATLVGNRVSGREPDGGALYTLGYNGEDRAANDPGFTGSHSSSVTLRNSVLAYSTSANDGSAVNDLVSDRPDTVVAWAHPLNYALMTVEQSHSLVTRSVALGLHFIYQDTWATSDPLLQALFANGGPTRTLAPLDGSPLIDAAPPASCAGQFDQRGVGRPVGVQCDIGAVEGKTTLLVTTAIDETATNGRCSLREALDNANNANTGRPDCGSGNAFHNTIRFAPEVSTIVLAGGVLGVFANVTIDGDRNGDGLPDVTIDAHDASANFVLGRSKTISLNGLNLIEGNAGGHEGGAFWIEDVDNIVTLSNSRVAGARTTARGGAIDAPVQNQLFVRNSVLENNTAGGSGGAIYSMALLEITDTRLLGNQAARGGALYNGLAATIARSTLGNNTATLDGGGVRNEGFLDIDASTLSANHAGASGGGVSNTVSVTLTNATLSGNSASDRGGGLQNANVSGAVVLLRQATVADNTALVGAAWSNARTLRVSRSIVSGAGPTNCSGAITDEGGNLSWGDASCAAIVQGNPLLGPLADNGGPTRTRMPASSSAAVDVLSCVANDIVVDQRRQPRPRGLLCDIGAIETEALFTIGGTLAGLAGDGLELMLNGVDVLALSTDGTFTFADALPRSATYVVFVQAQPEQPWQTCSVTRGSGTITTSNVTQVQVTCVTDTEGVGGTVTGLLGSGLVLSLNGGAQTHAVAADGAFAFTQPIASGTPYAVTIAVQPASPSQACSVLNGSGTVGGETVNDIVVTCIERIFADGFDP